MQRFRTGALALVVASGLAAAACGGSTPSAVSPSSPGASATPATSSAPPSVNPGGPRDVRVHLEQIASVHEPIALAVRTGDPDLYVAEQSGQVVAFRPGTRAAPRTILDLSGEITSGGEQGLLGITFSPDGEWFYASFTDRNGDSNVVAYRFSSGRPETPGRRILFVNQPFSNHNGGNIVFGPDGMLYLGLGDGGSEDDPQGNGQRMSTLLAKMVRIDPTPDGSRPYLVPSSNPFVGRAGVRPEIWASGLRNPWRFSFDRTTGDLWIGDVGQNRWEEIDEQPAGSNGGEDYGWSCFEGDHRFKACQAPGAVAPVSEYSHDDGGCAVVGGYVYRGAAIPSLDGAYVFGDYCDPALHALVRTANGVRTWDLGPDVQGLVSFGQDARGELYALSSGGGVYRLVP